MPFVGWELGVGYVTLACSCGGADVPVGLKALCVAECLCRGGDSKSAV